ncbi:MAG: SDR family oxidoreductase [Firmicutes bacterium]|nr:SDR family oxidoreductase [Bacillota bacterium]
MKNNRILVLGASGMAGHTITLYFQEKGYDVSTLTQNHFSVFANKNIVLDVFEREKLENIINEGDFDAIINCVGILNEFANNNPDKAIYLNSYLPHYLSNLTKNTKTKIIQMSTDCVFSGKKGQYAEYDFKDGETFYDRSKALGEIDNNKDLTFRNSIIGPDINENGIGLFNWFMKQDKPIKGYSRAMWTGVTTVTLARAMEQAIVQNLTGIYNLVNNQSISKYELLQLFNMYFRKSSVKIEKNDEVKIDKSLLRTRSDFKFEVPSYEEMVKEMSEWVLTHKEYYKSYKL